MSSGYSGAKAYGHEYENERRRKECHVRESLAQCPVGEVEYHQCDGGRSKRVEDPFKKNYGFETHVGIADSLWGEYLDWLDATRPLRTEKPSEQPGGES